MHNEKTEDIILFPKESHFTDDSVMTVAIADKLLHDDKAACKDLDPLWKEVDDRCYYTHNNREARVGAKAVATAVFRIILCQRETVLLTVGNSCCPFYFVF